MITFFNIIIILVRSSCFHSEKFNKKTCLLQTVQMLQSILMHIFLRQFAVPDNAHEIAFKLSIFNINLPSRYAECNKERTFKFQALVFLSFYCFLLCSLYSVKLYADRTYKFYCFRYK